MSLDVAERTISKVLVLESGRKHADSINKVCREHSLVGVTLHPQRLPTVLRSNIDFGAVLVAESYRNNVDDLVRVANDIHAIRPELPLILRREKQADWSGLPESLQSLFCGVYTIHDTVGLSKALDEHVFSMVYPSALVRGIGEFSEAMLRSQFPNIIVTRDSPYIVRDRIIYGELFSLIPIESGWCRGYMMLQTAQDGLKRLMSKNPYRQGTSFRDVNSLLGELTNLIWGSFKNRFIGDGDIPASQVQVPLLVNHANRYISFGSEDPQLCFLYRLTDPDSGESLKLYQRFVFSLSWDPEGFKELEKTSNAAVEAGELELF